eukprot:UC4_evm1s991
MESTDPRTMSEQPSGNAPLSPSQPQHPTTASDQDAAVAFNSLVKHGAANAPVAGLPSKWDNRDKSPLLSMVHGLRVKYRGQGDSEKDAVSVRANRPLPPACGLYYYEIKIINRGRQGFIAVGLCSESSQKDKLPGLDKTSYGYHANDGKSYSCNSVGEEIEANFGQSSFSFDIESERVETKANIESAIRGMVSPETSWQSTLEKLVLDYLVHHGYSETAMKLSKTIGIEVEEGEAAIQQRKGNIGIALEKISVLCPDFPSKNPDLYFRLKCRNFIEVLGSSKDEDLDMIMNLGQELQDLSETKGICNTKNKAIMEEVHFSPALAFSLLAYPDPKSGPLAWLLESQMRAGLAEELNGAIIASNGGEKTSAIERVIKQSEICLSRMLAEGMGAAAFVNLGAMMGKN